MRVRPPQRLEDAAPASACRRPISAAARAAPPSRHRRNPPRAPRLACAADHSAAAIQRHRSPIHASEGTGPLSAPRPVSRRAHESRPRARPLLSGRHRITSMRRLTEGGCDGSSGDDGQGRRGSTGVRRPVGRQAVCRAGCRGAVGDGHGSAGRSPAGRHGDGLGAATAGREGRHRREGRLSRARAATGHLPGACRAPGIQVRADHGESGVGPRDDNRRRARRRGPGGSRLGHDRRGGRPTSTSSVSRRPRGRHVELPSAASIGRPTVTCRRPASSASARIRSRRSRPTSTPRRTPTSAGS